MAYGLIYTFTFQDEIYEAPATFRIDIEKKDYVGNVTEWPFLAESPVVLDRYSEDENKLTAIIGTKLTISVVYDGVSPIPHPSTFKSIQEDVYRVNVYKNGVIHFRGFVKPDAANYPFADPPFTYQINATDYFNGMKSKVIDLNIGTQFYYAPITLADFIARTVFNAVDFNDAVINVLCAIEPKSMITNGNILGNVYLHTDAFYSLTDGPMKIYDALQLFLKSFRARLFFSAGTYWLQRISDVYGGFSTVMQYVYPLAPNLTFPIAKSQATYKDDFYVIEDSGQISVSPAIYSQVAEYKLKSINQIRNFAWLDFTEPNTIDEWIVFPNYVVDRVGIGGATDPFRLRIFEPTPGEGTATMRQLITNVQIGQRIQLQLKFLGNYAKDIAIGVLIGSTTDPGNSYVMDSGGNWVRLQTGGASNLIFGVTMSKSGFTEVDILSAPIPEYTPNFPLTIYIAYPRPIDGGPPVGEQTWVELYPAFLRIFQSSISSIESTTTNDKVFSYIPEKEQLFFLDTEDSFISNTVFMDDGTDIVPIPLNDWKDDGLEMDDTLDYLAGMTVLDNFNESSNVLEADIRSNTLEFYQSIKVNEIDNGVTLMQISDSYDLKAGIHKVVAHQIFPKHYGDGTYTTKNLIDT